MVRLRSAVGGNVLDVDVLAASKGDEDDDDDIVVLPVLLLLLRLVLNGEEMDSWVAIRRVRRGIISIENDVAYKTQPLLNQSIDQPSNVCRNNIQRQRQERTNEAFW